MFRKLLIIAMFFTAAGYCFAAQTLPQVVTSEVFYKESVDRSADQFVDTTAYETVDVVEYQPQPQVIETAPAYIPTWPIAGTDADVEVACESKGCEKSKQQDNIRIVSKIGADLVVENNFNLGAGRADGYGGWSGGANMLHGNQIPVGFDDECGNGSEMPLLHREVLEDDGANILTVSRSGRRDCTKYADGYTAYMAKMGMLEKAYSDDSDAPGAAFGLSGSVTNATMSGDGMSMDIYADGEIGVHISADAEAPQQVTDQVRSWVVASGQTLREVLQSWCDKEGWDLVWTTAREYPIEASAVFKGRFVDVASALVRNFGRATPVPYAKFYKGNRVLVVSTTDE